MSQLLRKMRRILQEPGNAVDGISVHEHWCNFQNNSQFMRFEHGRVYAATMKPGDPLFLAAKTLATVANNDVLQFLTRQFVDLAVVDFRGTGKFFEIRQTANGLREMVFRNGSSSLFMFQQPMIEASIVGQFAELAYDELRIMPEFLDSYEFVAKPRGAQPDFVEFFNAMVYQDDPAWRIVLDEIFGQWFVDDRIDLIRDQLNFLAGKNGLREILRVKKSTWLRKLAYRLAA